MSRFRSRITSLLASAAIGAVACGAPALAVDPVTDSMRPMDGPTATSPSDTNRNFQRDVERAPSLSERFGLPKISGPIPPILPPVRQQPVFDTPDNAWPPPVNRARQRGEDG